MGTQIDCTRWQDNASDYIEGGLSLEAMGWMRTHLLSCADCRQDEAVLRGLYRELRDVPSVEPPLYFRDNVMSAIERGERAKNAPLLPRLLRIATGTLVTATVAAGLVWTLFVPHAKKGISVATESGLHTIKVISSLETLLPGSSNDLSTGSNGSSTEDTDTPHVRVGRSKTLLPDNSIACDISLWLENAKEGSARINLLGEPQVYHVLLNRNMPQTVRIPYSKAQNGMTIGLQVSWVAEGYSQQKVLFIPIAVGESTSPAHQSFGLPEESVIDAARDIAIHYNRPVTLEDVSPALRTTITAKEESAVQTLRRHLAPAHLRVTESLSGLLIAPDTTSSSAR